MDTKEFISVTQLCTHYRIEMSFISSLKEIGLLDFTTIEQTKCVPHKKLTDIEKMIRLHQELDINPEGIDVIFNLLQKVEKLNKELIKAKNKLQVYDEAL